MSLIHNERTKLTASCLNAISAASIAVGALAQLAPLFSGASIIDRGAAGAFSLAWTALGVAYMRSPD